MKTFIPILFIYLFIVFPVFAKKPKANVIPTPIIKKTVFDNQVDALVEKHLGTGFHRASVYDFYPMNLPPKLAKLKESQRLEWVEYFSYTRRDLQKLSQGDLLKVLKADFDGDRVVDHVVIAYDAKTEAKKLLIANSNKILLQEDFEDGYLESFNSGLPGSTVIHKGGKFFSSGPCFRLQGFETPSSIVCYSKAIWTKLEPL